MDNKTVIGLLAMFSFLAILFTEQGQDTWKFFFVLGLMFGIFWYRKK